jgi:hypothetical protein
MPCRTGDGFASGWPHVSIVRAEMYEDRGSSFLSNFDVYTTLRTLQSPYSPTREIQTSQRVKPYKINSINESLALCSQLMRSKWTCLNQETIPQPAWPLTWRQGSPVTSYCHSGFLIYLVNTTCISDRVIPSSVTMLSTVFINITYWSYCNVLNCWLKAT